jgi:uncharacterized membrane protein
MMSDQQFNEAVLEKIQADKIKPLPKWLFVWRNVLIWSLGVLSLISGSIAVSLIIYMQSLDEWGVYQSMKLNYLEMMSVMVPIFWLVSLALFVGLLYYNVKKTERGYRYRPIYVVAGALALSVVLGIVCHFAGVSRWLDDFLSERAPYYERVMSPALSYWSDPASGRLIGIVTTELINDRFGLLSPEAREWEILWESNKDRHQPVLLPGLVVKCLGRQVGEGRFVAEQVLPMVPGRKFFKRGQKDCPHRQWQEVTCSRVLVERLGGGDYEVRTYWQLR